MFPNRNGKEKLARWQEVMGRLDDLKKKESTVQVSINTGGNISTLEFSRDSREAEILLEDLKDVDEGKKIGILRTDLPNRPIVIRLKGGSES